MRRGGRRPLSSPGAAIAGLALWNLLALAACGGGETPAPTTPAALPEVASVPTAPAPQPSPTPVPGSEPDPEPVPGTPRGGGGTASCGEPVPPPVTRMNVKPHGGSGDRVLLDSTPIVGPDAAYCKRIGYTDGRTFCPVRLEGHPERASCEAARVGRASDTGRAGPTWSANGRRCNGPDGGASCLNHSENQYLVWAYGSGTFRACTQAGVCGEVTLQ